MTIIQRRAVRAILLTQDHQVLLMQAQEPSSNFRIWYTPGGGIKPIEDAEACLRREILEETGLSNVMIGPLIWRRHHIFEWGKHTYNQQEDFYLTPIEKFDPCMNANPSEIERNSFRQFKWWTFPEIYKAKDEFAPRLLAEHLESLILNGIPKTPIDVGV